MKYREDKVDITNIEIEPITQNLENRVLLKLSLKRNPTGKTVTVIMMNPSKANQKRSDKTINRVIDCFYDEQKLKVRNIKIVNLFPYYNPKSITLHENIMSSRKTQSRLMQDNRDAIRLAIKESDYIF